VPKPNTNLFDRDGEFNFPIALAGPSIVGAVFLVQSLLGYGDSSLIDAIVFEAVALVPLAGMLPIILDQRREDAFRAWLFVRPSSQRTAPTTTASVCARTRSWYVSTTSGHCC
jgi:hypothetical protein